MSELEKDFNRKLSELIKINEAQLYLLEAIELLQQLKDICNDKWNGENYMVKVTIVEPNITKEENDENLKKILEVIKKIAEHEVQAIREGE